MCKSYGYSTGFLSLCAFICCFGALHMLNRIVHINSDEAALGAEFQMSRNDSKRCQQTIFIDSKAMSTHLTWLELFFIKWTLVLTILYAFIVMILVRAQYMSHFDINYINSNAMILVGCLLFVVLLLATVILHNRMPFTEVWCNKLIVGFMYLIAINILMAVVFFLIHSCWYYFQLAERDF